jgi:phosphoglycerate dehydrogenase-like enzyme
MLSSPVLFTNSKGIHGPPIGDTVLAMILYFARGLDFGMADKARGRWNQDPYYRADHPLVELAQSVVGIYGFGGIGREVGARARALGARVLAFDMEPPDQERGAADSGEAGLECLYGPAGFSRLLAESDFLVLTAPETPTTRAAFDGEALARMKRGAVLINVSRGGLVVEEALLEALEAGRLRGVGLDVYQTEPIPAGHPIWSFPNVVVTPHVAGVSRHFWRRQTDLIVKNIRRYLAGEPLLNLVDKEAGF